MEDLLNPFNGIEACPACTTPRYGVSLMYCEGRHARASGVGGRFVDMQQVGQQGIPHLHVKCGACGYEWLEHPACATEGAHTAPAPRS